MYKNMTDGVRDNEHESEVDTPKQNVDYSKTFHQSDKGNQQETRYADMDDIMALITWNV